VVNLSGLTDTAPAPLGLLLRIHLLQIWRRLKSIRDQSPLLTTVIFLFVGGYLGLSFWLFFKGLQFVIAFPGLGTVLTERLLYLLFAFLFGLLLLSNLVICYTNFFQNRESVFLFTQPIPAQTIFNWKFIESASLASWAFLFLIAPLLVAFGLTHDAAWHFYVITLLLIGLFILLPGVTGAWLAIHLARYFDRRSFQITVISGGILLLVMAAFWWQSTPSSDDLIESRVLEVLDRLLLKTHFAQYPLLPSFWLARSVLQWADDALSGAVFFILVLLSYSLFFGMLAFTRLGKAFASTASAVQGRTSVVRSKLLADRGSWERGGIVRFGFERSISWLMPWLREDVRALLAKDAKMFWRDTTQWGQSVMLFGLLGVYIVNLQHFTYELSSPFWTNLIAFLNLGACSLNLATLTTRFVYPQFSLEGRRLWIIGLAPLGLARVVKAKFWLAGVSSFVVTLPLISLSCYLLRMNWDQIAFFAAVVTVMTYALNGLAVGLGVLFPNFKETNPGKIVSGFGGTLCLVLSFLYILASVLILAFGTGGWHSHVAWIWESITVFGLLSALVGWLPLRLGLQQLKNFEF
jgi:ABC-2 type transport system permease protein